jgi:hypothetical protein
MDSEGPGTTVEWLRASRTDDDRLIRPAGFQRANRSWSLSSRSRALGDLVEAGFHPLFQRHDRGAHDPLDVREDDFPVEPGQDRDEIVRRPS